MENSNQHADRLRRRIKILIAVLSITLIILGYTLYMVANNSGGEQFRNPIDEPIAKNNVEKVRAWPKSTRNSSKGVIYDTADIRKYLDVYYPEIIKQLTKDGSGNPPAGYEWKVGFYWMMSKDSSDNKTKRDFCVMPILVTKNKKEKFTVLDYFDDANSIYNHVPNKSTFSGTGSAYDNGQMWP